MASNNEAQLVPDFVQGAKKVVRPDHLQRPHPGEVFKRRCVDKSPLKQPEIAQRLGISTKHLSRFINGHVDLTIDLARRLESVSGISAAAWMNYKVAYELYKTASQKRPLNLIF